MKMQKPKFFVSRTRCENHVSGDQCHFQVKWKINPHMKIGAVAPMRAESQHRHFTDQLAAAGADIHFVDYVHGAFDSVFIKDNAVVTEDARGMRALIGSAATPERAMEQAHREKFLRRFGVEIVRKSPVALEGGDVVKGISSSDPGAFLGYGFRTSNAAAEVLRRFLGQDVVPLELVDPYFYHLDTALSLVRANDETYAFAAREAFSPAAWENLRRIMGKEKVFAVPRAEALAFGLNWVEVNGTVFIGSRVPWIQARLAELGLRSAFTPLSQFQIAGGSAACLVSKIHAHSHSSEVSVCANH